MKEVTNEQLAQLKEKMPVSWRIQSANEKFAVCVPYVDARDAMDKLDVVVGPANWQRDHKDLKGNMYGGLGIKIDGSWVWKWDNGSESNIEAGKGEASDSFKRACVNWGIGRFCYSMPPVRLKTKAREFKGRTYYDPVDDQGNKIWDLSNHINSIQSGSTKQSTRPENNLPWLNEKGKDFITEAAAIILGGRTVEQIRNRYKISKSVAEKLAKASQVDISGYRAEIARAKTPEQFQTLADTFAGLKSAVIKYALSNLLSAKMKAEGIGYKKTEGFYVKEKAAA